ncbi:MAG: hypothetical protein KatS3mg060_0765 [Dehalococcoidia bacterium]|nr:MAG: hypothetical protein KatS3mg060_0765 [Dehalococcoidia bacterium]
MADALNRWRLLAADSERAWQVIDFQNGTVQLDLVSHTVLFTLEEFRELAAIVSGLATAAAPLAIVAGRPSRSLSRCLCHGNWAVVIDRTVLRFSPEGFGTLCRLCGEALARLAAVPCQNGLGAGYPLN